LWLPELLSQALNTKSLILLGRGRLEEGLGLLKHALEIALEHDRAAAATRAYFNLAHGYAVRDRWQDALAVDREGLALARKRGLRHDELQFLHHLGADLYVVGEWDEALEQLDVMRELGGETRLARWSLGVWPKPLLDCARGDVPPVPEDEPDADRQSRAGTNVGRGAILLAHGKFAEALEAGESAWQSRDAMGMHVFVKAGFTLAVEAAFA